ncbi:interferon regulatory factor 3-like [Leucoraja erinacea]|uniref:interferon regulatory factor 3-like n=1 Tax=Leucoraja erinaceus TaxID=7782 RepID=UPI002453A8BE|nr:interferon regulatory factor 3-like [Leucoraja erinacea]
MNNNRPQLRPWLIDQVNSGRFPGLRWVNGRRNMFRIPWKHASRQDLTQDDYRIFRDWAIASGRFNGQDADDPPKWKTNFRCALNSNESFKMLTDLSKESTDPHKVYFIVDHNPEPPPDGAMGVDEELESILHLSPEADPTQPGFPPLPLDEVMPNFGSMSLSDSPSDQLDAGHPLFLQPQQGGAAVSCLLSEAAEQEGGAGELGGHCLGGGPRSRKGERSAVGRCREGERAGRGASANRDLCTPPLPSTPRPLTPNLPLWAPVLISGQEPSDLDITVYYRGLQVLHCTVTNPGGCRFYSRQEEPALSQLQPVRLPPTDGLPDIKQRDFTEQLLASVEGGLLLHHWAGDVLAERLGRCQVFWARSESGPDLELEPGAGAGPGGGAIKLNRNQRTHILCLKDFVRGEQGRTKRGHSQRQRPGAEGVHGAPRGAPNCAAFLCFGQQFLRSNKNKKLILVKVVPLAWVALTEMAQHCGASSLDSDNVSLQISSTASLDSLLALLREVEDMELDL